MISKFKADLHLRWRFTAGTVLAPPQNQQVLPSPEKLPKLDFHNHLSQQHKQGEKKKKNNYYCRTGQNGAVVAAGSAVPTQQSHLLGAAEATLVQPRTIKPASKSKTGAFAHLLLIFIMLFLLTNEV